MDVNAALRENPRLGIETVRALIRQTPYSEVEEALVNTPDYDTVLLATAGMLQLFQIDPKDWTTPAHIMSIVYLLGAHRVGRETLLNRLLGEG